MKFKTVIGIFLLGVALIAGIWRYENAEPPELPPRNPTEVAKPANEPEPRRIAAPRNRAVLPPNPAELSASLRQVADTTADRDQRLRAVRNLPADLGPAEFDQLFSQLQQPAAQDETPWGLEFKNEIMDKLCAADAPGLAGLLTGIYESKSQNTVIRDYALQHLIEHYQRLAETDSGRIPRGELRELTRVLWDAVKETDSTIAGTALLGLSRLSTKIPDLDPARVGTAASRLAGDLSSTLGS